MKTKAKLLLVGGLLVTLCNGLGQPLITIQPQSQLVSLGANVTFNVSVSGFEPFSYQWQRSEAALAGETNATLILTNVQLTQAGNYTVVVTDGFGDATTSHAASLTVDPTFTKITTGAIVNDGGSSYGCAWGDYDNDGFIDLVVANGWGHVNFLYRNNGDGTFTRIAAGPVAEDMADTDAVVWGDYDNDGHLDLFVANFETPQTDVLYRNQGQGTFAKVIQGPFGNDAGLGVGAAWADYDRDGWLDLFVANSQGQNDFLYRGGSGGLFTKTLSGPVVTSGGSSIGCAWGDHDNDGDPDLVVANFPLAGETGNDFLFLNQGSGNFTRITSGPVPTDGAKAGSPAWGDYDNDGDLDLIVVNSADQNDRLYRNEGYGNFALVSSSPVSMDQSSSLGVAWGDYDNDGWLDLFVGSVFGDRNRLYHNRGDGTFELVNDSVIGAEGGISLGCAWGDYDNDGFLDLFVANAGPDADVFGENNNYLYRNNGNANRWLLLKLVGSASNRSAIGTKVRLQATIGGRAFWQLREVSGGSGYCSQNDLRAHFGLGDATNAEIIRIEWPSGTVQELRNVVVNQTLTVTEPPRLQTMGRQPDGSFQFRITGGIGFCYGLETSSNLTAWAPWTTVTNASHTMLVTDPSASNAPQRFYRAVQQ